MVTGDVQISTVHIYANTDPIRVKEPVKNRCYRSAIVCLVLLCVLLLTAVIVLCVMFIQERDQQTIKIDNLSKFFENVTNERNQLMWEKSELQKNLNKTDKNQDLIIERTALTDGWIYYHFSLYFISSEKKNWNESRKYCRDKGADLIIINNKEEQDFVNMSCKEHVWIGLTDSDEEDKWKWVDGSILNSRFWRFGEPNSLGGDEDCVETYTTGWNDLACTDALQSICEKHF